MILAEESVLKKCRQSHGQSTAKMASQLQGQSQILRVSERSVMAAASASGCVSWSRTTHLAHENVTVESYFQRQWQMQTM
jgi:hypothetical protein